MTCFASTEHNTGHVCEKVMDGNSGSSWRTRSEGIGAWIQLNFGGLYQVENIKIKHKDNNRGEMFKNISLEFSNGRIVNYTLNNYFNNYPTKYWNEIDLINNPPASEFVKITATSVYGSGHNGFADVRVYGCLTGNP